MDKYEVGFKDNYGTETIEAEWVESDGTSYWFRKNDGVKTATVGLVPIEATMYVKRLDG